MARPSASSANAPKVAHQLHPTKSGKLTPRDICAYWTREVWWLSDKDHRHVWKGPVEPRARTGRWICSMCANHRVLGSIIEQHVLERARTAIDAALARGNGAGSVKARKKAPRQHCPVPGCKNAATRVFGMVCAEHKDVPKAKIKKYREARRAKKLRNARLTDPAYPVSTSSCLSLPGLLNLAGKSSVRSELA